MKNALILLAEGFEEIEALSVVDIFRRAGLACDMCSVHNIEVAGSHGIKVKADILLKDIDVNRYDVLILPGGMPGSINLRDDDRVIDIVRNFNEKGRIIAAICAAPIVLYKAGVLKGLKVTSHPSVAKQFESCEYVEDLTVKSGNIITSRGPATAVYFAFEILKSLGLESQVLELKNGMMVEFVEQKIAHEF